MRNSPRFCASKCGKTDVRRPRQREEKALKPSGFKAFPMAGAEGLEVASQPLLRCPKKSSGYRFSSIFSTAAPTPARCPRCRRRSQALPGTRLWRGCRDSKNHRNSALSRRLPPVKIVFDAVLMLYDLAGGCVKYKTASLCILLSCIEG